MFDMDVPRNRLRFPPPDDERVWCEICGWRLVTSVCEWDGYTVALCADDADEWWRLLSVWGRLQGESENG
jgi:hypothetical protein